MNADDPTADDALQVLREAHYTAMKYRIATLDDCRLLAEMNHQLLQDERHRNRFMTLPQLEERMRGFLSGDYRAVIFQDDGEVVSYALYRE